MKSKLNQAYKNQNTKQSVAIIVLCLVLTILVIYRTVYIYKHQHRLQIIYIDSLRPAVYKTSPRFLSIGLDAKVIADKFRSFNMSAPKLIAMIKFLEPGYLRIGGNLADRVQFSLNSKIDDFEDNGLQLIDEDSLDLFPNITLHASDWLKLNNLANRTNMEIFFGLNALLRTRNGSWDSKNAESMIKFSAANKLKLNWELGNEPNSYRHKFNEVVNASQMAKDFAELRKILNKYSTYKYSFLVGPDVTRPQYNPESQIYLEEFVKNIKNEVNKITWHQYYLNGHNSSAKDFLDTKIYDLLSFQINRVKEITNKTGKAIWLGETSSAYGGGAPKLSDRFIASFLWVDKLGLAAKMGVEVVMRQSIFYGNYSLLDDNYDPNPDWWISLFYKTFVGQRVIPLYNVTTEGVRLYAHCSAANIKNSITIFGFNVENTPANVEIQGLSPTHIFGQLYALVYQLQTQNLESKDVYCNGRVLKMLPGNKLPNVIKSKQKIYPYLTIPPFSIVFWIIPNVNVKACL